VTDLELTDRSRGAVGETTAEKPGIFISYARSDSSALAEESVAGVELAGFRPFLDRQDIAAAEDWEARLGALILGADTIVFILSPAAVRSERCAWEVQRAAELGKRADPGSGSGGAGGGGSGAAAAPQLHLLSRRPVFRAAAARIGGGSAAGCRMDSRTYAVE
jgi:hypothetical protein